MKSAARRTCSQSLAPAALEPPGQHHGERHLVELQAGPELRAVHLRVLPERAVGLLHEPQVVHEPVGRRVVAGHLLGGGHVVEVARPDQVVGAGLLAPHGIWVVLLERQRAPHPRHRRRGDRGARIELVLRGLEHHQRLVVEPPLLVVAAYADRRPVERAEVVPPPARVVRRDPLEAAPERPAGVAQRGPAIGSEADRERHVPAAAAVAELRPRGLHHVAGLPGVVAPPQSPLGRERDPRVARRRRVAARRVAQPRLGHDGARGGVVPRQQRRAGGLRAVVVAVVAGGRIGDQVDLERPPGPRLEAHVGQHRRAPRVGHPGLHQPPARGLRRLAEGERAR